MRFAVCAVFWTGLFVCSVTTYSFATSDVAILHVMVTDPASGHPVRGLTDRDFDIVVDGSEVHPLSVAELTEPLSLGLLFDVSASVDVRFLEPPRDWSNEVKEAVLTKLTSRDSFGFGTFGARSTFRLLEPSSDARLSSVRQSFGDRSIGLNGPSRLWDTIDQALKVLAGVPGRRALIVLTDGRASGNHLGLADVIRSAQESDSPVIVIASGYQPQSKTVPEESTPLPLLKRLASESGGIWSLDYTGDVFRPRQPGPWLASAVESLRATYVVRVPIESGPQTHTVVVHAGQGVAVHVRSQF